MGPPSIKKVLCNFFYSIYLSSKDIQPSDAAAVFVSTFFYEKTDHNFKVTKKSYRGSAITLFLDNNNNNNKTVSYKRGPLAILSTRLS